MSENLLGFLHKELTSCIESTELQEWIRREHGGGWLRVAEPFVRDREHKWGADIGIVVDYHVEDKLHHKWGYLLQAKKAQRDSEKPTRWDIDPSQLHDLLLATRSAFYVLYTPIKAEPAPFVVPARVIASTLDAAALKRRRPVKSISYEAGRDLGKSWTAFWLDDIFGAWSGDPDTDVIKRIEETDFVHVLFKVELMVGRDIG